MDFLGVGFLSLLWAEGEGPSGHKTQEGHLPIAALMVW